MYLFLPPLLDSLFSLLILFFNSKKKKITVFRVYRSKSLGIVSLTRWALCIEFDSAFVSTINDKDNIKNDNNIRGSVLILTLKRVKIVTGSSWLKFAEICSECSCII